MFPRRKVVAVCLVLALAGLSLLFLYANAITPRAMRVGDIGGGDLGTPVRVRGHVHRAWTTDGGNAALVLMDYEDFATIRVIARPYAIERPALVAPGAFVQVTGEIFGSGTVQVFVDDVGGVTVLAPPSTNLLPLEFVARNAARLDGQRVVVRAVLEEARTVVDPRHALLRGDGAEVWAYAADGWRGGWTSVTGRLFESSDGRCELFVGPEPEAEDASVAALAACPEALVGRPVRVRNAFAEPGELIGSALTLQDLGDGAQFHVEAFVRDWDWERAARPPRLGDPLTVDGVVEYQATRARWRIVSDLIPRP